MAKPSDQKRVFPYRLRSQGETLVFHLLDQDCIEALARFARQLPDEDLLFLERDIRQQHVITEWIEEAAQGRLVTILASRDDELLGYATFERGPARWTRHVAELRAVVAESARGRGVGRMLLELVFEMALDDGVAKLLARMTPDQTRAQSLFERLGFQQEAVLRDHAMDANGLTHDLLVLSYHVRDQQESRCGDCGVHVLKALCLDGICLCSHCFETKYEELGGGD